MERQEFCSLYSSESSEGLVLFSVKAITSPAGFEGMDRSQQIPQTVRPPWDTPRMPLMHAKFIRMCAHTHTHTHTASCPLDGYIALGRWSASIMLKCTFIHCFRLLWINQTSIRIPESTGESRCVSKTERQRETIARQVVRKGEKQEQVVCYNR